MKKAMKKVVAAVLVAGLGIFALNGTGFAEEKTAEDVQISEMETSSIVSKDENALILAVKDTEDKGIKEIQVQLNDGSVHEFTDYPYSELNVGENTLVRVSEYVNDASEKETVIYLLDFLDYMDVYDVTNEEGTIQSVKKVEEDEFLFQVAFGDGSSYEVTLYADENYVTENEFVVGNTKPLSLLRTFDHDGNEVSVEIYFDIDDAADTDYIFSSEEGKILSVARGEEEDENIFEVKLSDGSVHSATLYADQDYLAEEAFVVGETKDFNIYRYVDEFGEVNSTEVYFNVGDGAYEEESYSYCEWTDEEGTIEKVTKGEDGESIFQVTLSDDSSHEVTLYEDEAFLQENGYVVGNTKSVAVYTFFDHQGEYAGTDVYFNEDWDTYGDTGEEITLVERTELATITKANQLDETGWAVTFTVGDRVEEYEFYNYGLSFKEGETRNVQATDYYDQENNLLFTFYDFVEEDLKEDEAI